MREGVMAEPAKVVPFNPRASLGQLRCTECGKTCDAPAPCDCGKPLEYVPAGKLAEEAVVATPEKSDRAIAEEIGVSRMTVARAREAVAPVTNVPPDKRVGLDGKSYTVPPTGERERLLKAQKKYWEVQKRETAVSASPKKRRSPSEVKRDHFDENIVDLAVFCIVWADIDTHWGPIDDDQRKQAIDHIEECEQMLRRLKARLAKADA
jgi:hypothetical protein